MKRLLVVAVLLTAACGSSGDYSDAAAALLQRDADSLASAARSGDATGVRSAWARLQADVAAQQKAGGLSGDRAQEVLAAGRVVATDVVGTALVAPTRSPAPKVTAAPVVTRAPAVPAPQPAPRKHKKKGHGEDD